MYYKHLRNWNHFLDRYKINTVVFPHITPGVPKYIVYALCKIKGIAVAMLNHSTLFEATYGYCTSDIKDPMSSFMEVYSKAEHEYEGQKDESITLPDDFEALYAKHTQTVNNKAPANMNNRKIFYRGRDVQKPILQVIKKKGVLYGAVSMLSRIHSFIAFIIRKMRFCVLIRAYDRLARHADFSVPYLYFPLHYQPEISSNPLGGIYVDQLLVVEMLAHYIPKDAMIYVKEHPHQYNAPHGKNKLLYSDIARLPNVRLISRKTDTFKLLEHCTAVVSLTGTAGFEGLMMGKPFLMFGYNPYMYAKGTFHISTKEECKEAVDHVFSKGAKHTMRDMRLYLKAMSSVLSRCDARLTRKYTNPADELSEEENSKRLTNLVIAALDTQLS
jgi:hypothetical protein